MIPPSLNRALFAASLVASLTSASARAHADGRPPARACTSALHEAQQRAHAGRFTDARDLYLKCARSGCAGVRKACAAGANEAGSELAHVAFIVSDGAGDPIARVLVKMDGQTLLTHLDGRAVAIDPGLHEFTFGAGVGEPARYVWMTRKFMVVQGQRDPISVTLPSTPAAPPEPAAGARDDASVADVASADEPASEAALSAPPPAPAPAPEPPPPGPPARRVRWAPWVAGGAGVLGLGAGALLTYWGRADNAALAQCAPSCRPSSVEHIHDLYLGADAAFAAGGVSIALAAVLFATSSHPREGAVPVGSDGPRRRRTGWSFDIQPTRSGALASVEGAFE